MIECVCIELKDNDNDAETSIGINKILTYSDIKKEQLIDIKLYKNKLLIFYDNPDDSL